jgi:ureidoacrylate peracid hydrolase
MVEFEISPGKTCLLIVDMTNAFLKAGSPLEVARGRDLIPKLRKLMGVCRDKGIPVIFTTQAHRQDGSDMGLFAAFQPAMRAKRILLEGTEDVEFYEDIQPEKVDIILTKRKFSALLGTELDSMLRSQGIDTIIIGGVATNMCCESTARDARMMDYKVIFLSDGTANRGLPDMGWGAISAEEVQRLVLTTMAYAYAQVLTVEDVIQRLSSSGQKTRKLAQLDALARGN